MSFFEGKRMTKIEKFQSDLENKLLVKNSVTNKTVLIYTYLCGHIPKHAEIVLKRLKKEGKLNYETKTPYLTYENVFRNKNIITYQIKQ